MLGDAGATLVMSLAPDPVQMDLIVLGRSAAQMPVELGVSVNQTVVGSLSFNPGLSLSRLAVQESALVSARNAVELRRTPSERSELSLIALWFRPNSARFLVDFGTPGARWLLASGFGPDESLEGRTAVRMTSAGARVTLPLRAAPTDYALVVSGRAGPGAGRDIELGLSLDKRQTGVVELGTEWSSAAVQLGTKDVPRGTTMLELLRVSGGDREVALDSIAVLPMVDSVLVDAGHPTGRPYLASGFSFDESVEVTSSVWSEGPSSHLLAPLNPASEPYVLSVRAKAFFPLAPLSVRVLVNGEEQGAFALGARFEVHEIGVSRLPLRAGINDLELVYSATEAPAARDRHASDSRRLGALFDWLELRPQTRGAALSNVTEP
jgi:hypothetical protein